MHHVTATSTATDLARRLLAFVVERYPFALEPVAAAIEASGGLAAASEDEIEAVRRPFEAALRARISGPGPVDVPDTTPGVTAARRYGAAVEIGRASCR